MGGWSRLAVVRRGSWRGHPPECGGGGHGRHGELHVARARVDGIQMDVVGVTPSVPEAGALVEDRTEGTARWSDGVGGASVRSGAQLVLDVVEGQRTDALRPAVTAPANLSAGAAARTFGEGVE